MPKKKEEEKKSSKSKPSADVFDAKKMNEEAKKAAMKACGASK